MFLRKYIPNGVGHWWVVFCAIITIFAISKAHALPTVCSVVKTSSFRGCLGMNITPSMCDFRQDHALILVIPSLSFILRLLAQEKLFLRNCQGFKRNFKQTKKFSLLMPKKMRVLFLIMAIP